VLKKLPLLNALRRLKHARLNGLAAQRKMVMMKVMMMMRRNW
jgi:hypothetical protein